MLNAFSGQSHPFGLCGTRNAGDINWSTAVSIGSFLVRGVMVMVMMMVVVVMVVVMLVIVIVVVTVTVTVGVVGSVAFLLTTAFGVSTAAGSLGRR